MHANLLVFDVSVGCALIAFGLVPGLFHRFMEGVRRFRQFPLTPRGSHEPVDQPTWLAGVGALVITAAILAYLSN